MPGSAPCIAVVGATGAVGLEALAILAARGHPAERVLAIASRRSVGQKIRYGEVELIAEARDLERLRAADAALLAAGPRVAGELAPALIQAGLIVVDTSPAFRADAGVPLIICGVNDEQVRGAPPPRLVASPNCSTIVLLVALEPLRRHFGIDHVAVTTYQAISGAGLRAVDELRVQTRAHLDGASTTPEVFRESCAFNVFPHESPVDPATGLNVEEREMIEETRRIWDDPTARIVPSCVRVPTLGAHGQSVTVRLRAPQSVDAVRQVLAAAPGVAVLDDREGGHFPTVRRAIGRDEILVGRIRRTPDGDDTIQLWICGDHLRKGAALNALQILDALT